jgi:hypothetical protein
MKGTGVYREAIHLPPGRLARFTAPVVVVLILVVAALALLPLPAPARVAIGAIGALYLIAAGLFVAMLSCVRVTLDDQALTVARRFLVARRFALERIAACAPNKAPVWGLSYRRRGMAFGPLTQGGCAVLLRLTNGAQVTFASADSATLCAALRAAPGDR